MARVRITAWAATIAFVFFTAALGQAAVELKVTSLPGAPHVNQMKWMEAWGKQHGVNIVRVPVAYEVYVEKVTTALVGKADIGDIIWHNDDWGQLWGRYLEPVEDLPALKTVDRILMDDIFTWEGHDTAVPFVETIGTFFYRTDLVKESEVPRTWDELVRVGRRLQQEGKVKWGFVGGMKYPHTWLTLLWALWSNECDFFQPVFERNNQVLAKNGWKSLVGEPCSIDVIEFWWDAIHAHKISSPGMPVYARTDADAIFMAGDAAFTMANTELYGKFSDPKTSKVPGKIGVMKWPRGPRATKSVAWRAAWAWAIPRHIPSEKKKFAKELINWLVENEEVQRDLWKSTGGIPPNRLVARKIMQEDPLMRKMLESTVFAERVVAAAYYFEGFPELHATYADYAIRAITGPRDKIPAVMREGAEKLHQIATGKE